MDEEHAKRLESLEKSVKWMVESTENSLAAQMVLSARFEALQETASKFFEQQGVRKFDPEEFRAALWEAEGEACNHMLASASDSSPSFATRLKNLVDALRKRV